MAMSKNTEQVTVEARKAERVQKHHGRELIPGCASSVMQSAIMFWPKLHT